MKPTKEIIELNEKLHEIGYRQEIKNGDWLSNPGECVCLYKAHRLDAKGKDYGCFIPSCSTIPSLEDGLAWLDSKFDNEIELWSSLNHKWICRYGHNSAWVKANTPHEAVLKAMVKVLENNDG